MLTIYRKDLCNIYFSKKKQEKFPAETWTIRIGHFAGKFDAKSGHVTIRCMPTIKESGKNY